MNARPGALLRGMTCDKVALSMIQYAQDNAVRQWLSESGPLAEVLDHYEPRNEQIEMACAVQAALGKKRHLAVEAGTGVGKSFAYLLAVLEQVFAGEGRALISTYTINLQEQLIEKDIPTLQRCLKTSFRAVLAKGRGHYLCPRRLKFALQRNRLLVDVSLGELVTLGEWADETEEGSLSTTPFVPSAQVWDAVKSEHGNCRGRKCRHYDRCFYWRARLSWEQADLIVANHALLFSDCVLKDSGYALLPEYRMLVLDEAHTLERVAEEHFGLDISAGRVKSLLNSLYHPRRRRGLLAVIGANDIIDQVQKARHVTEVFFDEVRQWYRRHERQAQGRCPQHVVPDSITAELKQLAKQLRKIQKDRDDDDERFELRRAIERCTGLVEDLGAFLGQRLDHHVYWIEVDERESGRVRLKSAPLNVGPDVKRCLFDPIKGVILTSATLSTAAPEDTSGFHFFAQRIGLDQYDGLRLGSPFDYQSQATLYLETSLPEPNAPQFIPAAVEVIKDYLLRHEGRSLVLFTSYAMLDKTAAILEDWLLDMGVTLLRQGPSQDRSSLLRTFKGPGVYVLFGTDSFWQGIDVVGDALTNVMIMRLPFAVPDQPLLAGRMEQIRQQGGNPFMDYQLPAAIIKFKQGFGRLIRSKHDQGSVVVLDSRIVTRRYGGQFLSAIPPCRIEQVRRDLDDPWDDGILSEDGGFD